MNSLLRFDNKQLCFTNWKTDLGFSKILRTHWFWKCWDCLEIEFDQRAWDRIFSCIDFRFVSVTSVILVSVERNFVYLLRSVVCSWGDQGHFLGCGVSDIGLIA